jgi:hypothetical protein
VIIDSTCHVSIQEPLRLNILADQPYGLPTMADYDPLCDDLEMSNVIGLFMIMKEIREQKPLDDPDALGIDDKGKPYY